MAITDKELTAPPMKTPDFCTELTVPRISYGKISRKSVMLSGLLIDYSTPMTIRSPTSAANELVIPDRNVHMDHIMQAAPSIR